MLKESRRSVNAAKSAGFLLATLLVLLLAAGCVSDTSTKTSSAAATPGVTVSTPSGDTSEAGDTATFTVALNTEPTAGVAITLASSDTAEGVPDMTSLVFSADDWSTPQTVTVTGVDDADLDGDQTYSIDFAPTTSGDADYDGLEISSLSMTNAGASRRPISIIKKIWSSSSKIEPKS